MYELYYGYIKNKYGNKTSLLFTDTDSFMYKIQTEDVYEDFNNDKEMLDFGNYSAKWKYYNNSNILVVGKMMDYLQKNIFGLKPKMYSFPVDGCSEYKKAKGANKNIVAK